MSSMAAVQLAPEAESDSTVVHLTARDRCDHSACGAQAYVVVMFSDDNTLFFCGHHYARHEKQLTAVATGVVDRRDLL